MIVFSPEFKQFAAEAHLAARLDYQGIEIFYQAIHVIGPEKSNKVSEFLKEIVRSKFSNEDIMTMWVKAETYTSLVNDIRPFTESIIDLLEHPRAPIHPEDQSF